ncbi:MAG: DUF3800 domain-containing protein [Bdellovibrionales bacterium]
MLILIDESGDSGFKIQKGSSQFFVVCMIVFKAFDEAEKCSAAIKKLQAERKIYPEFKFSNSRAEIRDAFFTAVAPFDYSIYALAVRKSEIYSQHLRTSNDSFYNYFVRQLISQHTHMLDKAHIKIDESGDREFKRQLAQYIRRMIPDGQIKKITFLSSRNDHLIQLADMVTGAIARTYSGKKDASRWHGMIAPKIANLWRFR